MKNLFKKFMKEEEGNVIEYVIVLAVIAIIIAAMFPGLRAKLLSWFKGMFSNVDQGISGGGAGQPCYDATHQTSPGTTVVDSVTGQQTCQ
jgi:Flp pilus assembly pilin Flp